MNTEPKYYQIYYLHMKNGEVVRIAEDYDIPVQKGIIGQFKRGQKKFFEYDTLIHGFTIPFDQISFIVACGVEKEM